MCSLSTPSYAQSAGFDNAYAPRGTETRVSFTIPLGNSSSKSKTAPRLGFAVRNYEQSSSPSMDWMLADREPYREAQLSFTLEKTPQFMMNDQLLVLPEGNQANIGTVGKIGLGVAAVAVVVAGYFALAIVSQDSA